MSCRRWPADTPCPRTLATSARQHTRPTSGLASIRAETAQRRRGEHPKHWQRLPPQQRLQWRRPAFKRANVNQITVKPASVQRADSKPTDVKPTDVKPINVKRANVKPVCRSILKFCEINAAHANRPSLRPCGAEMAGGGFGPGPSVARAGSSPSVGLYQSDQYVRCPVRTVRDGGFACECLKPGCLQVRERCVSAPTRTLSTIKR